MLALERQPLNAAGNEFAYTRGPSGASDVMMWAWDEVLYLPWFAVMGMTEHEKRALMELCRLKCPPPDDLALVRRSPPGEDPPEELAEVPCG